MARPLAKLVSLITPKRRWAQFSLATMFLAVAIICVWLAVQVNRAHRQRDAVQAILTLHGNIGYRGDREPHFPHDLILIASLDEHVRRPTKDFTDDVTHVFLNTNTAIANASDEICDHLRNLPSLEVLSLQGTAITDTGLQ